MAVLYKSNGEIIKDIEPANGKRFTLDEVHRLVDCDGVELLFIRCSRVIMLVDELGKIRRKDINPKATKIYHSAERMNIHDWIAGDALVCNYDQF